MRRAFTLIETLIVIAILAILLGLLAPVLATAREAGRAGVCLSNLRSAANLCWIYANDHGGLGPAIGAPYWKPPAWSVIVQQYSGRQGDTGSRVHHERSALVCPSCDAFYADRDMTRTYAMNATGHAGLGPESDPPVSPPDPDHYDLAPVGIRFDLVERPSRTPLLVDSAVAWLPDGAPPPTQTSSVIDFRQASHLERRLGRFHAAETFHAAMLDASAAPRRQIADEWRLPLPGAPVSFR